MALRASTIGWVVRAAVGAGILYIIFSFIPFHEVARAIANVDPVFIGLAALILLAERSAAAVRIKILTDQNRMPLSSLRILEINIIASFYSMFLPGDLAAGAVRWYKMSRPGKKRAEAFTAITFDRLVDTTGLFAVGLLFWFLDDPPLPTNQIPWLFAGGLVLLVAALSFSLSRNAQHRILALEARLPQTTLIRTVFSKIAKVTQSVASYRDLPLRAVVTLLSLTLARHVFSVLMLYCYVLALQVDLGLLPLLWIRSLVNLVTMLPLTVAGLGVREGAFLILLGYYGVSGVEAVTMALLIWLMNVLLATVGGLLEMKNVLRAGHGKRNASWS